MTSALIFAGGVGKRMNPSSSAKPKQFLELHGKPVLIYTIEHFEKHTEIDNIIVVCLKEYIDELNILLRRYAINKVVKIVEGGATGDKSIYNGLEFMQNISSPDDIVLIHDGTRPLISRKLISDNINKVRDCGICITVESVAESIMQIGADGEVSSFPPRHEMFFAKAPQSFRYKLIVDLYKRASEDGFTPLDSSHLCSNYGVEMHTVKSSPDNIKITTPSDYYIFRALYESMESKQILGL